jgi:hypothetical protein
VCLLWLGTRYQSGQAVRGLRFDKGTVLKVGKIFEVTSEIKILQQVHDSDNAAENEEDKEIWKDWTSDNNNSNKRIEEGESAYNTRGRNETLPSTTPFDLTTKNTNSNNTGTMGRKYGVREHMQHSLHTEVDDNNGKSSEALAVSSTKLSAISLKKMLEYEDISSNLANSKTTPVPDPSSVAMVENKNEYMSTAM